MSNIGSVATEHRCCCGCMHVKTGAIIVAILEAINFILGLTFAAITKSVAIICIFTASVIVGTILLTCLLYGIYSKRPGFLLPFLVTQIIATMVGSILFIIIIIFAVMAKSKGSYALLDDSHESAEIKAIVIIVFSAIEIIVHICFAWIIYRCYAYLRAEVRSHHIISEPVEDRKIKLNIKVLSDPVDPLDHQLPFAFKPVCPTPPPAYNDC